VKTSQNNFGKFYQIPTLESNKETFKKLLVGAEESNKIYSSWIAELDENSRATREVLKGEADPANIKKSMICGSTPMEKCLTSFLHCH